MSLLCINITVYLCHCVRIAVSKHYNIVNKMIPKLLVSLLQPQATVQAISIAGQWPWLQGRDRCLGVVSPYGCSVFYHLNHCM
jgi:hypothetical protein